MTGQVWRLRQIRRTALLLTALSLLVVLLSAYLRLDGAGLGCADWPACYGGLLSGEPQAQPFAPLRLLHRATASVFLLLACYLLWLCLRRPSIRPAVPPATLLVLLVLALSALGFWSSDPRLVLVGFLNIIGGFGLVTFSWRVVLASRPEYRCERAPALVLRLGVAMLSLTVVFGALIGAGYAALTCVSLPDCGGRWWPAATFWAELTPFSTLAGVPAAGDAGGIGLHLLHRWAALGTLVLLGAAALQALGDEATRKAAVTLLLLLLGEIALGGLTVSSGFNLWLAAGHAVCTAALLATSSTLLQRR